MTNKFKTIVSSALVASLFAAGPANGETKKIELKEKWSGLFPVEKLDLLAKDQRKNRVGTVDEKKWKEFWKAFEAKDKKELPKVDFKKKMVVFVRNVRYLNRINVFSAQVTDGELSVRAAETRTARPINDKVAMAIIIVPRDGIKKVSPR